MSHSSAQSKIDIERDGMHIFRIMYRCQVLERHMVDELNLKLDVDDHIEHDAIEWNYQYIFEHTKFVPSRLDPALKWLVENDLVIYSHGQYYRTTEGDLAYQDASRQGQFATACPAQKFKAEALSGLKTGGIPDNPNWQRSELTSAALPATAPHEAACKDPIDLVFAAKKMLKIAAEHGVNPSQIRQWSSDGLMQTCKKCRHWRRHYPRNKDGATLESVCAMCTNARRRKR